MDDIEKFDKVQKDLQMIMTIVLKKPEEAEKELDKLLGVSNILYKDRKDIPKDLEEKICTYLFGAK